METNIENFDPKEIESNLKTFETRGFGSYEGLVNQIKEAAAVVLTAFSKISIPSGNAEAARLVSLAKTNLEQSVMWATKAVSRSH